MKVYNKVKIYYQYIQNIPLQPESPTCVNSRNRYIISAGRYFILYKSQLQSTIALSTIESEYGVLNQAMRVINPIRETLFETIETVNLVGTQLRYPLVGKRKELLSFPTVVHEDVYVALILAVNQKITNRAMHWCVKYQFFGVRV